MKITELSKNALVKDLNGNILKVFKVDYSKNIVFLRDGGKFFNNPRSVFGIPIAVDFFESSKFHKAPEDVYFFKTKEYTFEYVLETKMLLIYQNERDDISEFSKKVEYIHELQQLILVLTGIEL